MQPDNNRNTIIFVVATAVIFLLYQFFVLAPQAARKKAEAAQRPAAAASAAQAPAAAGPRFSSREAALAATQRVEIRTSALTGSISLTGARFDDLKLGPADGKGDAVHPAYRQTIEANSPPVELFRPAGLRHAYFTQFGWFGENLPGLPDMNTPWRVVEGDVLSPGKPVTLGYDNGSGLSFRRTIAVDDQYMFTVVDRVANRGAAPVVMRPYASVQRHGVPTDLGRNPIVHEGAIGVFDGKTKLIKYGDWAKQKGKEDAADPRTLRTGWLGITDKYWLAAVVPDQALRGQGRFRVTGLPGGVNVHEAVFEGKAVSIAPGRQWTQTTRLFAGAKRAEVLRGYEENVAAFPAGSRGEPRPAPASDAARPAGVQQFDMAIDWGMFWFFTRPIFLALEFFYKLVGNFGLAIIALTVAVKLLFFPLANQAFASMAKIKKLQPKQEELKKKFGDDQARLQQEMMQLYQREKINPLAGCLPILIQIPVFYALYKVLTVTIEMRHAPFYGWIKDLSVTDPTTMWNLFGLLPFDPGAIPLVGSLLVGTGFLHIGLWPLIYGVTMWLQTSMSPTSPDPTQQMIMKWFPVIFTVMLAQVAAGLVIYWAWSNLLTIVQQYIIMRRHKTENPIDGIIARLQGKEYKVEA